MTVNLSSFLDQDVIVTFRNGEVHEGYLEHTTDGNGAYPYWLETKGNIWSFQENGRYSRENVTGYDVVDIKLADGVLPSGNATKKVAMALLPDIAAALQQDEDFKKFMRKKIERRLDKLLDGGLVDKTFDQVAEVLVQSIIVTTKAR